MRGSMWMWAVVLCVGCGSSVDLGGGSGGSRNGGSRNGGSRNGGDDAGMLGTGGVSAGTAGSAGTNAGIAGSGGMGDAGVVTGGSAGTNAGIAGSAGTNAGIAGSGGMGDAGVVTGGSAGTNAGIAGSGGMDAGVAGSAGVFDCEGMCCDGTTHYCHIVSSGASLTSGTPTDDAGLVTCSDAGTSTRCVPLPAGCVGAPSCACVATQDPYSPICTCNDQGGGITVTCFNP